MKHINEVATVKTTCKTHALDIAQTHLESEFNTQMEYYFETK